MTSNQKELVNELHTDKSKISELRNLLNELDKEKESWYKKKEEFSKKIKDCIIQIRQNKEQRDNLTAEVKGLKQKRNNLNKEISSKLDELKKLKKEKTSLIQSLNLKESPSGIKQKIERLEFKIETEPMSFEKEQKLMKSINKLRESYENSKVIIGIDKKIKEVSDAIKDMKKEANVHHRQMQEKAKQSQSLHESILNTSAEIDKLKVEEEHSFKKFSEIKSKFNDINSQLKEHLKSMSDIKSELDRISNEKKERRKAEQDSILKSKEEQLNEKIKRREKLTTEDLLIFQHLKKE